jgi:L-amino acid N-acyltransferase
MHFSVRDAAETDLSDILAIYNEAILSSLAVFTEQETTLEERQSWFEQRTRAGYPVLVAGDTAGPVLGFSTFGDFRAWPGYRFHERLGFTRAGRLCEVGHKFDRWLDLVFLQRAL